MIFPDIVQNMWMQFKGQKMDYVITVCDNAKESCPIFPWGGQSYALAFSRPTPSVRVKVTRY